MDSSLFLLLFTYDIEVQLSLCSGTLNQLQNWILRDLVLIWVSIVLVRAHIP